MRKPLTTKTTINDFKNTYYLKEELEDFCRMNNLPISGRKTELIERIEAFLSGKTLSVAKTQTVVKDDGPPSLDKIITAGYKNSQENRHFFEKHIGSKFRFSVQFQNWMKGNIGKTFQDGVNAWYEIEKDRKSKAGKNEIDSQFEYNQYTRDFFKNTKGYSRADCIKCWKYKRDKPGSNRFEMSDLEVLN